jgi:predicted membrane protein
MSLELLIYLADISDKFHHAGLVLALMIFIMGFVTTAILDVILTDKKLIIVPIVTIFLVLSTIILTILTPSKETIYTIAAVKLGKEVSKNEKVLETTDKLYKILNSKLDEMLKENSKKE